MVHSRRGNTRECKKVSNEITTINKGEKRPRRRRGHGTLIARDGYWVMRWRQDGHAVQEKTQFKATKSGREKAEALLEERTEIFRLKKTQDQLAVLIQRRESIEQRLRRLQDDAMPETRSLTLGEVEAEWRASPRRKDCSAAQLERYAGQLGAFVTWAGAKLDIRAVGDEMAERYAKELASKSAANTYNKHLNTLSAVWKAIGRARRLPNPWADLPRKRLDTHVRRALSPEEVEKVINAAEGEWRALMLIGARTGLRLGDACRLTWEKFEADGVLRVMTTKTGAPVALPGTAIKAELERAIGAGERKGEIMPTIAAMYRADPSRVAKGVKAIFTAAGIKTSAKEKGWKKSRPDASFHSLRHTFVTRAIEAGVAAPIVRALVGHATAAMTDRYTHVSEEAVLKAFRAAKI